MFGTWTTRTHYVLDADGCIAPGPMPERLDDRPVSRTYSFRNPTETIVDDAYLTSFRVSASFAPAPTMEWTPGDTEGVWQAVRPFVREHGLLGFLPQRLLAIAFDAEPDRRHKADGEEKVRLCFRTALGWTESSNPAVLSPGMSLVQSGYETSIVPAQKWAEWFTDGRVRAPCDDGFWAHYREPIGDLADFFLDALPRLASEAAVASVPRRKQRYEDVHPDDVLASLHGFGAPSLSWAGSATEPGMKRIQRRITAQVLFPSLASFLMHRTLENIVAGTAKQCEADRCGRWFVVLKHMKQIYCSPTCSGRMRQRGKRDRDRKAKKGKRVTRAKRS